MSKSFQIDAKFSPAGDQPAAIKALVEGLEAGEAGMTLLGVTGSGKSVGYEEPLLIVEEFPDGSQQTKVVDAGPYIDKLMDSGDGAIHWEGDTQVLQLGKEGRRYCYSYDPDTGNVGLYPVQAFTRHRSPEQMYHLTTACGREVTLTADHNLWVLRSGELCLIRTDEVADGDCLPLPEAVTASGAIQEIDVIDYLHDESLYVYLGDTLSRYENQHKIKEVADVFAASGISAYPKIWAIRHGEKGQGIKLSTFRTLVRDNRNFAQLIDYNDVLVGARGRRMAIPARIPLAPAVLSLLGLFISEGCLQRGCVLFSNHEPVLRKQIECALNELGLSYGQRIDTDYQVSSTALAHLLGNLCGKGAHNKRLPSFWTSLSDEHLGLLLRSYFDGDGTVDRKGEVSAVTASRGLASDVAYALFRFGIWARIRRIKKRASNSAHIGGEYYQVIISGQDSLQVFEQNVGFEHPGKARLLTECLARIGNTNVDRLPVDGAAIRDLRTKLGLSMAKLAGSVGCSRPALSLIESQKRQPSRCLLRKILGALLDEANSKKVLPSEWIRKWRGLEGLTRVRWTPIREIKQAEYSYPFVYDLSVPGPETFFAGFGGLFVHNTYTIANVIQQVQRPTLIMAHNKTLAAQLYGEMKEFFPGNSVEYFVSYYDYYQPEAYVPASDTFIEKDASINEHIEQMRLSATKALLERRDTIIIATVSAIYGLGDPQSYLGMMLHLVRGDTIDQREILRRLAELQYTRNDVELLRATYRVRGEVIDVFPAESDAEAVRIELFDDEIEQLSYFDPLTGEVLRRVPRLTVYPKSHYVTPRQTLLDAVEQIKVELKERLEELREQDKLVEAQRLEQRTRFDIEMILELGYCSGIENYSRYLSGRQAGEPPPTLFDYLPDEALLVIDESHVTVSQIGAMYKGDRSRKENLVNYGFRLPSALDNRPMRFDEFERIAPQTIYVSATPAKYELAHSGAVVEQVVRPTGLVDPQVEVRPALTQVDDLLSEIHKCSDKNERVLVTTLTKRMSEDLTDYLEEHGVRVRYLHSDIDTVERIEIIRDLRLGEFDVLVGINLLREGLDMPEVSLVAILDADKEGFLRSETSLIQTIGRAARNLHGRAILYADRITGSMKRAIDETERRRAKQVAYNQAHGITPRGVEKAVQDIMESGYPGVPGKPKQYARVAEELIEYSALSGKELQKRLKELEEKMYQHARNLEFEAAARVRDEIKRIQEQNLGLGEPAAD